MTKTYIAMESQKSECEVLSDSLTDGHHLHVGPVPDDFSQSPIGKLPVDCLIYIFSLLPIIDRVRIQRGTYTHL